MNKAAIQDLTPLMLLLAVVLAAASGVQARQATDGNFEMLRGVVVSDEPAPKPVPRARVSVEWDGGRSEPVSTDEQGRFETRAPASRPSIVKVAKAGFAPWEGRRARNATDRPIEVRLARGAVVTGTVVDRAGAPAVGVTVTVRRTADRSGVGTTSPERQADTDDRGEFRVGNLPAGRYELALSPFTSLHLVTPTSSGSTEVRLKYLGAAGSSPTSVVQLRAGEESAVPLVQEPASAGVNSAAFAVGRSPGTGAPATASASSGQARRAGAIRGQITDAGGRPVKGALVRVAFGDGAIRMVDSDDEGRYEVNGLAAGVFEIVASKPGFVQTAYRADTADRSGRRVTLREGERVAGINVALLRGGVISGMVVDESGDPIEGLTVEVWQSRLSAGHSLVSPVPDVAAVKTDDRGQYRLYGVNPGSYYVAVAPEKRGSKGFFAAQGNLEGDALVISGHVELSSLSGASGAPVFYPGHTSIGEALPVQIDAGRDALGVDITFLSGPLARVRGEAIDSSGQPFRGTVSLSISARSGAPVLESRTTSVADGTFEFANVPPGDYVVQALSAGPHLVTLASSDASVERAGAGQPEFGMAFATVSEADALAAPVFIQTSAGSTVTGRLVLEGSADAAISGLRLRATPVDLDYAPRDGKPASAPIGVGREFELEGLTGPVRFDLEGRLPDGWWLKSVNIDGVNAADEPVTFGASSQARSGVEVVLSNDGAEISGQVAGAGAQGGASIIVFGIAPERWFERSRHLKTARTDRNGRFTIAGLPPGEYWVAAVDGGFAPQDAGEWVRPSVLSSLTASARRVTVREGGRVSVELRRSQVSR